ncbi:MAG TPA: hypothetical protein VEW42_02505 [Candidatus Eisenbacteria bacterium]|nr:hypothetical protein [Candidatus Eisenbacteria bacterium]
MQKYTAPSINLAKNRGEHLSDRILTFALTIGRVLVIITEAVALGAFLYRFGLDRQLVDLHDRIKQEQAIVTLLKRNESVYRNLQDRLTLEKNINDGTASDLKLFTDILKVIPSDMTLTGIALSNTNIHMEGSIPSLVSLSSLVKQLKGYPTVDRVSLDKLENKTSEGTIAISITVFMKKIAAKPLL